YWVPAFAGTTIERFERAAPGSPLPVPAKAGIAGTSRSLNDHASGVRLVDRMAAIDVERGAADEGGAVGREIDDRLCHFRGLAGAAGGELGVQLRPSVLISEEALGPRHDVRQVPARNGRPRIDRDHAHAVAHALPTQALREHVEGDVGHAARDVAVVGIAGGRTHDIDDDAAPSRAHARIDGAREIDVAEELDVPRLAPGLAVDLRERTGGNVACIVDQDVYVGAGLAERLHLGRPRKIAAMDRYRDAVFAGQPVRELGHRLLIASGEVQVAALRRQVLRDYKA